MRCLALPVLVAFVLAAVGCFIDKGSGAVSTQGDVSATQSETSTTSTTSSSAASSATTADPSSTTLDTSMTLDTSTTLGTSTTLDTSTLDAPTTGTTTGVEPDVYEQLCGDLCDKLAGCGVSDPWCYDQCVVDFMPGEPACQEAGVDLMECILEAKCAALRTKGICEQETTKSLLLCGACSQEKVHQYDVCTVSYECTDLHTLTCTGDLCVCMHNDEEIASCVIADLCDQDDAAIFEAATACCPWA